MTPSEDALLLPVLCANS